jgi:hypothetical protein
LVAALLGESQVRKISQREAHRLSKRVAQMEHENSVRVSKYSTAYPGGHNIITLTLDPSATERLYTAQLLGFALVARYDRGTALIYAVMP